MQHEENTGTKFSSVIAFTFSEKESLTLAKAVLDLFTDYKIFVLEGDLGSGKTTFVKWFCQHLKAIDEVSSPTFSLVNEYRFADKQVIYHMDLYRIEQEEELIDIGFEDYLELGKFILIEWADLALPFLDKFVHLKFESLSKSTRKIIISEMQ